MAAFTYWIDGASGNDTTGDGSFGNPYATVGKGITVGASQADGSTIKVNVLDTASYEMPAVTTNVTFDGVPNSTLTIQGVSDASETPALVDIPAPATGDCLFLYARSSSTVTIQGFAVDFSPSVASGTAQDFVRYRDADGGQIIVQYCSFVGSTTTTAPAAARNIIDLDTTARPDLGEVRYCYIKNMEGPVCDVAGSGTRIWDLHHNVYYWNCTTVPSYLVVQATAASASNDVRFYNNTLVIDVGAVASAFSGFGQHPASSGDQGRMDLHSNVVYFNSQKSGTAVTQLWLGGTGGSYSTENIGSNVYYFGADVASGDVTAIYSGAPYVGPYTDTTAYEQAASALFLNAATPYNWDANDSGYVLPLAGDWRLAAETTSGLGGILPGALASPDIDISVVASASDTGPDESDSINIGIRVGNAGPSNEASLVISAPVPSGLTYVSDVASNGSYDSGTGLWTLSVNASGSQTLTITATVDSGTRGTTITFTGSVSSASGTDTDTSNDTDSVNILVGVEPGAPTLPEYLDVLPSFKPVYKVDFDPTFIISIAGTEVDLTTFDQQRPDKSLCSEWTARRLVIAASTTAVINMGGVDSGRFLLIEASAVVNVAIGDSLVNVSWPVKEIAVNSDFSELHIQNPSATDAVTVQLIIVD